MRRKVLVVVGRLWVARLGRTGAVFERTRVLLGLLRRRWRTVDVGLGAGRCGVTTYEPISVPVSAFHLLLLLLLGRWADAALVSRLACFSVVAHVAGEVVVDALWREGRDVGERAAFVVAVHVVRLVGVGTAVAAVHCAV